MRRAGINGRLKIAALFPSVRDQGRIKIFLIRRVKGVQRFGAVIEPDASAIWFTELQLRKFPPCRKNILPLCF